MITTFHFQNHSFEEASFTENLLKMVPFGLSITSDVTRPFLLLKDETQHHTLPVAISHLEAGVTLSQANKTVPPASPHRFTSLLLNQMGLTLERCVFVEIRGLHQYVQIDLKTSTGGFSGPMKLRADEAMSLCLYLNVPIFANLNYIEKSKILTAEIDTLSNSVTMKELILQKKENYVM